MSSWEIGCSRWCRGLVAWLVLVVFLFFFGFLVGATLLGGVAVLETRLEVFLWDGLFGGSWLV